MGFGDVQAKLAKSVMSKTKTKKSSKSSSKKTYGTIKGKTITAIQYKRDGSKLYFSGRELVRELNPQGKSVARVQASTSGRGGRKTPTKTPSQQMAQKLKESTVRLEQQKAKLKALQEGRTAPQQRARLANRRFVAKVTKDLQQLSSDEAEKARRRLLASNLDVGNAAKISLQGAVYQQTLNNIRNSPFDMDVIRALQQAIDVSKVDPNKYRYGKINIAGIDVEPSSLKELNFYKRLQRVEKRNQKVAKLANEIQTRALQGQEKRGVTKFLENKKTLRLFIDGMTKLGVGVLVYPFAIFQALDNAIIEVRGSMSRKNINTNLKKNLRYIPQVVALKLPKRLTDKIANKITGVLPEKLTSPSRVAKEVKASRPQKIKTTITEVGKSFDPRKPQNWANIITIIAGLALSGISVRASLSKIKSNYLPSKRGISTIEKGVNDILKASPEIKKGIRQQIKSSVSKREKNYYSRQLSRALRLEKVAKSLKSKMKVYRLAESKGELLSVIDMNPMIKTAELLKLQGKNKYLYHATTTQIKKAFKSGDIDFISPKAGELVKARVRKASFKPRRNLASPSKFDKALVTFFRRTGGIVGGGRAQNVFVKRVFKRKTIDYDVFYKNNKAAAQKALAYMKRKFPKDDISLELLKIPNSKLRVYRLKVNGKDIADFDIMPKDLGAPVKVGKDLVASPEFLASRKLSTLGDIRKVGRQAKDTADLKRLLGRVFTDKEFIKRVSSPKDVLKVLPQPSGMDKSRIKFFETQFFLDTEVSIGYAINSLIKPRLGKWLPRAQGFVNTVAGKKVVLPKLFRQKIFKRGAKGVIIRLKGDIGRLPKALLDRVRSASKGRLNKSQTAKLRKDLVEYIESPKNIKKLTIGSRTGSLPTGEREIVFKTFANLYKGKGKQKFTVDPETKLLSEVIDVTIKQTKPTSKAGRILTRLKNKVKVFTPSQLKLRLGKGDLTKLRSYRKLLRLQAKVTDQNYRDLLYFLDSMMASKKGSRSLTRGFNLKAASSGRKRISKKIVPRKIGKIAKRATPAIAKRTKVRVAKRSVVRVKPRARKRVFSRARPRTVVRPRTAPRTRTKPRTAPRVRPRPRTTPRPRPRIVPRRTARTVRLPPRRPKRITAILRKKKRVSKSDKKELLEYVKKSKPVYRPSLSALVYGITAYKIPKSVSPFNVRPLLVEMRKKKILK